MKLLIILIPTILILELISCSTENKGKTIGDPLSVPFVINESKLANSDNLEFNYSTDTTMKSFDGKIVVLNCKLHNGNDDTLYFYTQSCYGWEYNFIVDTNLVQIYPWIDCCVSNPMIKKVAPKSDFEFNGHFYVKNRNVKNVEVEYYIYQVDSKFNIRNSDSIKKLQKTVIKNSGGTKS